MGLRHDPSGPHCPTCKETYGEGEYFIDMDWKHLCCCWHWRTTDFLNPNATVPGPHLKPGEQHHHWEQQC